MCERLKSQNNISIELEVDWQSGWSCKQLPLHISSCCEAARWDYCILSSEVRELLLIGFLGVRSLVSLCVQWGTGP